jgi:hypothetical protein
MGYLDDLKKKESQHLKEVRKTIRLKKGARAKVRVRQNVRGVKKAVSYVPSGLLGTGKISKTALKERNRRRRGRKSVLKKAFKLIW